MVFNCEDYITYKKVDPTEIIEIGDIVMIDTATGYITRAVKGEKGDLPINTRMVVGVCINSNNIANLNILIDGGSSKDIERIELSSRSDDTDIILIDGGNSEQNQREIIQVAYSGEWPVNVCGFVDIGDRLSISNHAGKAKSIDYYDKDYFLVRSIGKAIKYLKNKEQVKVLLDIE